MASTPTLKGKISLNNAPFVAGLKKSLRAGVGFAGSMVRNLAKIGLAASAAGLIIGAAFAFGPLRKGVSDIINATDALVDMRASTGLAVGEMYSLGKQFELGGLGSEEMTKSVGKMQYQLAQSYKTGRGVTATIQRLGLNIDDIVKMSPGDQFEHIGRAIAGLPQPIDRANAAMELFGRSGNKLLPVFASFSNGIGLGNLRNAAVEIEYNADLFDQAADNMLVARAALSNINVGIAAAIAPAIIQISEAVKETDWVGYGKTLGEGLSYGLRVGWALFKLLDKAPSFLKASWDSFFSTINVAWMKVFNGISKAFNGINDMLGGKLGKNIDLFSDQDIANSVAEGMKATKTATAIREAFAKGLKDAFNMTTPERPKTPGPPEKMQKSLLPLARPSVAGSLQPQGDLRDRTRPTSLIPGDTHGGSLGNTHGGGTLDTLRNPHLLTGGIAGQKGVETVQSNLSFNERRSIQDGVVAAGGKRQGSTPGAYNAVRFGDKKRRDAFKAERERAKTGVEKSNEILSGMAEDLDTVAGALKE